MSIDLIKEAECNHSGQGEDSNSFAEGGGHWIVVDSSSQNLNLEDILNQKKQQSKQKQKMQ